MSAASHDETIARIKEGWQQPMVDLKSSVGRLGSTLFDQGTTKLSRLKARGCDALVTKLKEVSYELDLRIREARSVLVVDDDLTIRELLSIVLRGGGFSVVQAADGEEAIDQIVSGKFGLVFLDLDMPRVNGFEVIDWIRTAVRAHLGIVVITGGEPDDEQIKFLQSKGCMLLRKPFEMKKVLELAGAGLARTAERFDVDEEQRGGPHGLERGAAEAG